MRLDAIGSCLSRNVTQYAILSYNITEPNWTTFSFSKPATDELPLIQVLYIIYIVLIC